MDYEPGYADTSCIRFQTQQTVIVMEPGRRAARDLRPYFTKSAVAVQHDGRRRVLMGGLTARCIMRKAGQ
jgi:hypothetical protein